MKRLGNTFSENFCFLCWRCNVDVFPHIVKIMCTKIYIHLFFASDAQLWPRHYVFFFCCLLSIAYDFGFYIPWVPTGIAVCCFCFIQYMINNTKCLRHNNCSLHVVYFQLWFTFIFQHCFMLNFFFNSVLFSLLMFLLCSRNTLFLLFSLKMFIVRESTYVNLVCLRCVLK